VVGVPESTSAEAILAAAMQAIAERGPGKLTLSAVASAAGVSRPTLYRWFPTKDDLLAAITVYAEEQFDAGLRAVVDARHDPAERLDAALRYLVLYLDGSMGPDVIGVDPGFALRSLADSLAPAVDVLVRLLDPAFDQVPAVRTGELSAEQAAELFLRLAYSHYLVPPADPELLLATMRSLAGVREPAVVEVVR
jgi:AcrR family transcriptional regulator